MDISGPLSQLLTPGEFTLATTTEQGAAFELSQQGGQGEGPPCRGAQGR